MNRTSAIHPKMLIALARFFTDVCTIMQANVTRTGSGATSSINWTPVDGLIDIPACLGKPKGKSGEVRQADMTYEIDTSTLLLAGYFPQIIDYNRALINDTQYDIVNVFRYAGELTTLEVEIVR